MDWKFGAGLLAAKALSMLNDEDLGPLAADANLAFAEWALRTHDPSGPERLQQVTELAQRRGLAWYAEEVQRVTLYGRELAR